MAFRGNRSFNPEEPGSIGGTTPAGAMFAGVQAFGAEAVPATSGSTFAHPLRVGPTSSAVGSRVLDVGIGPSAAWIQSRDKNDYSVNYGLDLNPNGGTITTGTANLVLGGIVVLKSYTVATLPAAGTAGGMIYVSDEAGGATPAFSDATNWRRTADRTIVS